MQSIENCIIIKSVELGLTDLGKEKKLSRFEFQINNQCVVNHWLLICCGTWAMSEKLRVLIRSCCCCSVAQLCLTLCNPTDCSMPCFPVLHHLLELAQNHHWVGDAIQTSHPLLLPSPPTFNLSQHQGLFQWVGSSHQVAKVLELQLQHQSFQWTVRTNFL